MRDDVLIQAIDNTEDVLLHGAKWTEEAKERVRQARRAGRRVSEMFGNLYNKGKFKKATQRSTKGSYDPDVDAYVSRNGGKSTYTHKDGSKTIIEPRKNSKGTYDSDVKAYVRRKGKKSIYTHKDGSKTIIDYDKNHLPRKKHKGTYDPDVNAYVTRKGGKSTYTHPDGSKTIIEPRKSSRKRHKK